MRLAVLNDAYPVGSETFVSEPVAWLRERGHDVAVVVARVGDAVDVDQPTWVVGRHPAAFARTARRGGVAFVTNVVRGRNSGRDLATRVTAAARAALPEIAGADHLLAHFGTIGDAWLPAAVIASRRLSVFFHGFDATEVLRAHPHRFDTLFASGAGILTNSAYLRDTLVKAGAPPNRLAIVRLGAAPGAFGAGATDLRRQQRVLTVARLVAKKGHADALAAFAATRTHGWSYDIVGAGPLRGPLRRRAAALGIAEHVTFDGQLGRPAIFAALRRASVFVLASKTDEFGNTEGTPVSILEAAAAGLPVVATQHAGIPEILPADAADRGFLVREGDVDALAAALGRLMGDERLRREWGAECRAFALAHHRPDHHIDALIAGLASVGAVPNIP